MDPNHIEEVYTRIPELVFGAEGWTDVNRSIIHDFNAVAGELYRFDTKTMVKVPIVAEGIPPNFKTIDYYAAGNLHEEDHQYLHFENNKSHFSSTQAAHDTSVTTGSYPSNASIPFGWGYWINSTFLRHGNTEFKYRLSRTKQQGRFHQHEIAEFEKYLKPLALASEIFLNIDNIRLKALLNENALNSINTAAIVLDDKQEVVFFNLAAETLLRQDDGLNINNNYLQLYPMAVNQRLSRAIEDVLKSSHQAIKHNPLPAHTNDYLIALRPSGRPPYRIKLSAISSKTQLPGFIYNSVLVLITDPSGTKKPSNDYLKAVYGLTKSEIQVTNLLMQGLDSTGVASSLGKKVSTVRQYIKSIMSKTSCNKQTELILLLNNLA